MGSIWKLIIVTLLLTIVAGLVMLLSNPRQPVKIIITPGQNLIENRVAVYGAVRSPGVYSYDGNIRIEAAVDLAGGVTDDADLVNANLSKWVDDGETIVIPTKGVLQPTLTPVSTQTRVNLNTADKSELMSLPGIGEKRASDIINLRETNGGLKTCEDILQISGISENLLKSIYDLIFID